MINWQVLVDWNGTAVFTGPYDDVTRFIIEVQGMTGCSDFTTRMAEVGSCTLTVDNSDRRFSTENIFSPLSGKLLMRRAVKVLVNNNILFYGFIESITSLGGFEGQIGSAPIATIYCRDWLALLQNNINIPIQFAISGDRLVKAALNTALLAAVASGTETIAAGNVSNNDWITIAGQKLTYKTTLSGAADEILIGGTNVDSIFNTVAAVNRDIGGGTLYAASMTPISDVSAAAASNVATFKATLRGLIGNSIAMTKSGANISLSGANLSGGADTTATLDIDTAVLSYDVAGDQWSAGNDTNALQAIGDVTRTEQGFFGQRGDTIFWRNQSFFFKQRASAITVTLNSLVSHDGKIDINDLYNFIRVRYSQRAYLSVGVVGNLQQVFMVPGHSGTDPRWNGTDVYPTGGNIMQTITYRDPVTALPMAVKSLVLPLVPNTDFFVNDRPDFTGYDYSTTGNIGISVAQLSTKAEVSLHNYAYGGLYVKLSLRGIGIVVYDPTEVLREDTASVAAKKERRPLSVDLPLPVDSIFANALVDYVLSQKKNDRYRLHKVSLGAQEKIGAVDLFARGINDVVALTDPWIGFENHKYMIAGIEFRIGYNGPEDHELTWYVERLDDAVYMLWDDATYGYGSVAGYAI